MELGPLQTKWVQFLKDNAHLQQKNSLGNNESGEMKYCCLGAARKIICEAEDSELTTMRLGETISITDVHESNNEAYHKMIGALQYSYSKIGLKSALGSFTKPGMGYTNLASMNDGGKTWIEIAEFIKSNPEAVFTKSV